MEHSIAIELTQGKVATIDKDDADLVVPNGERWYAHVVPRKHGDPVFYATRRAKSSGSNTHVLMHRIITGAKTGEIVDHINGDTLDNRRSNLRICTVSDNTYNRRVMRPSSSKFRGVDYQIISRKWRAVIGKGGESIFLGEYRTEEEAALAYNGAAIILYGDWAHLNSLEQEEVWTH